MHPRKAIRHAVVAQLTGKTSAGQSVFATREVPWRQVELPGISVYTLEEDDQNGKRPVKLAVLLVASLNEKVDDALDDLAAEVEAVLNADLSFGGTAMASRYTGMLEEILENQGVPVGAMRITYEAWYLGRPSVLSSSTA